MSPQCPEASLHHHHHHHHHVNRGRSSHHRLTGVWVWSRNDGAVSSLHLLCLPGDVIKEGPHLPHLFSHTHTHTMRLLAETLTHTRARNARVTVLKKSSMPAALPAGSITSHVTPLQLIARRKSNMAPAAEHEASPGIFPTKGATAQTPAGCWDRLFTVSAPPWRCPGSYTSSENL